VLTNEENELLTRTDPGTPCGELLRRYWQPVALGEELPAGGSPVPVRLLGEDLVLFRDDHGRPGLLGLHCAHRGADLSYGRIEDGGLRCIYHGWLYDVDGRCLEQPGEPEPLTGAEAGAYTQDQATRGGAAPRRFYERIHHTAYPCREAGGAIFAYLGPGEPPLLPSFDFLTAPDDRVYAVKLFSDCNYLQGNEGNIDLLHVSFLHHSSRDQDPLRSLGPVLSNGNGTAEQRLSSRGAAPFVETVEGQAVDVGLRICKIRQLPDGGRYVRVGTFIMPNLCATPNGQVNWHVPIDDAHHWKYTFIFSQDKPLNREAVSRRHTITAEYTPVANRSNRYLQNRAAMLSASYSGIDPSFFQQQDLCATEGAGAIQDRSREHLAPSDAPIAVARTLLRSAIKQVADGRDPPGVVRDDDLNDYPSIVTTSGVLPTGVGWREHCDRLAAQRRGWQTRTG
jgi:phthalate 4,5-dioxygenase